MTDQSIHIPISEDSVLIESVWANIEQRIEDTTDKFANIFDIYKMTTYSQSGLTANVYNSDCDISVDSTTIIIPVEVYVWVSDLDMQYSINGAQKLIDQGIILTVSNKKYVQVSIEDSITIPLTDTISFDYLIEKVKSGVTTSLPFSLSWETSCYDKYGVVVSRPSYEIRKNEVIFEYPIMAVARIKVTACGYLHTLNFLVENSADSIQAVKNSISAQNTINSAFGSYSVEDTSQNKSVSVSVSGLDIELHYTGGDDDTELIDQTVSIEVPEAIMNCLSQCDNGILSPYGSNTSFSGPSPPEEEGSVWTDVYYSACNGSILDVIRRNIK